MLHAINFLSGFSGPQDSPEVFIMRAVVCINAISIVFNTTV
jgi:hypothetical protein